jgi:hypothetical protein
MTERRPEDYLILGTALTPGTVTLSGHDRVKNWDVKAAKGQTGASSSLNGNPIGKFKARFYLADEEDFEAWERFQFLLETMVGGPTPVALPVYHPDLILNNFTEVSVSSIGGVSRDRNGGRSVEVEFIEYKPPKPKAISKAKAKPAGKVAATGAAPTPKPDPNADAKRELASLLAKAREP